MIKKIIKVADFLVVVLIVYILLKSYSGYYTHVFRYFKSFGYISLTLSVDLLILSSLLFRLYLVLSSGKVRLKNRNIINKLEVLFFFIYFTSFQILDYGTRFFIYKVTILYPSLIYLLIDG
jgi:hypothetical protein